MISDLVIGPSAGGDPIVDRAGLEIAPGEVVALLGASGSGKTTLALSLLGHLRPGLTLRSGRVRVDGRDPFGPGGHALRGTVVSFLGQDPAAALNPARRIGAQLGEVAGPGRVAALLAAMDLPADRAFTRRRPAEISGGQAQRVALAIALAADPRLLVLDEPTSGLDAPLARDLRERLAAYLRDRDCAALLITHDTRLADALAHRVVHLGARPETSAARSSVRPRAVERDRTERSSVEPSAIERRRTERPPMEPGVAEPRQGAASFVERGTAERCRVEPSAGALLRVRDLRAGYGRRVVIDGVSFGVAPGGCTALTGPSGAGKSTAARCVAGLTARAGGLITLGGEDLAPAAARRSAAQRRAVQFVGQDSIGALNPRETALQALRRPLSARDPSDVDDRARELLRRVRLPESAAGRRPGALSGGERQRLNLARALAAAPRLLVCDEITSALDRRTAHAVLDLLAELRDRDGLGVLLVSHDPDAVARAAQHVVEIPRPHDHEEHRT